MNNSKTELETLREENEALRKALHGIETVLDFERQDRVRAEAALVDAALIHAKLIEERDEALVKLDCARTELEGARSTSDYLLDQVNSLRDKADVRLSFAEKRLSEMTVERDELRYKLAGEAAHIKSLEDLLVDAVRERDEARAQVARREREHEALLETAQKALAHAERERDEARAEVERLREAAASSMALCSWECSDETYCGRCKPLVRALNEADE